MTRHLDGAAVRSPVPVPPTGRLVMLIIYALALAAVPTGEPLPFIILAAALAIATAAAGVGAASVARRLPVVAPLLVTAALIPLVAHGPGPTVLGLQLSSAGIAAAWTLAARSILGVLAASTLAATTSAAELGRAARRLHAPPALVAMAMMMVRYLHLTAEQFDLAKRSMRARGFEARWFWHYRPLAASAGTLFIRSYERGERVHAAMVSRGFNGTTPPAAGYALAGPVTSSPWHRWGPVVGLTLAAAAAVAIGRLA